jgi:acyl-homoserine lactone synthase
MLLPKAVGAAMIYIVSEENRRRFHHLLTEMHRHRKQVFIDKLNWRLDESAGLEIDSYDSHDAIYLIEAGTPTSHVSVSARLLPTVRPHLLSEQFADLCEERLPAGPNIWEATRFCPAPDTPAGAPRRDMLGRMIAGIMETAFLFGIDQVTYVADAALAPMALKAGWDARALGAPRGKGRTRIQAFVASIDGAGLKRVREAFAITAPLTRFVPAELARAA